MKSNTIKKCYGGTLTFASAVLLTSLSVCNTTNAATITAPDPATNGTSDDPYYFKNFRHINSTNSDDISLGTLATPNTSYLSQPDIGGQSVNQMRGLRARQPGFLNTGDILLHVKKDLPGAAENNVYLTGIRGNFSLNNEGAITLGATGGEATDGSFSDGVRGEADVEVYGIHGDVGTNSSSGVINIKANGGTATDTGNSEYADADANAKAYGIYGDVQTNNGAITVNSHGGTATASASAEGDVEAGAMARSHTAGLTRNFYHDNSYIETNNGEIRVIATGGTATATAHSDSGDASADADVQINAYGIGSHIGTNNGAIRVNATGGTATASSSSDTSANASANAYGIVIIHKPSLLTNNGAINIEATAGKESLDGGATYRSGDAKAYGIYFQNFSEETSTLHSSDLISAKATLAEGLEGGTATDYQVYSSGGLSITGYAMKFNNQTQVTADYAGAIHAGSNINSVFDNATLYAYTDNHFNNGATFDIPTLVEGANISDQFTTAQLGITSPDYKLTLIDGEGEKLQQLGVAYDPKNSTPLMATQVSQKITSQGVAIVKGNLMKPMLSMMQKSNPQLASYEGVRLASSNPTLTPADMDLDIMPEKRGWAFVMPFYTNLDDNSSPMGYDADVFGVSGGYNYWVNPDLILGFHAGYGHGDIDFTGTGYDKKEEDVDAGSLGFQGIYRLDNNWLLEGVASFFYTSNDYDDYNPLNRENGDYNTHGLDSTITLNYVYAVNPQHNIIPSLGLRYLWQHNDSFTAKNENNADVHYGDVDENQLYAQLGVDWYGNYQTDNKWNVVSNIGIGVEQALTDNEYSNTMTVGSARSTVTNDIDDTSLTTSASIEFTKDSLAFGIGYNGSYSSDLKDSSLHLQMKYFF